MKERPILFSGPMVRAILEGRKSQTRRVLAKQPRPDSVTRHCWYDAPIYGFTNEAAPTANWFKVKCPYGLPGDRLMVKEATWLWCERRPNGLTKTGRLKWHYVPVPNTPAVYCADHPQKPDWGYPIETRSGNVQMWKYKAARFCPKWASRITLEITDVRVQRLQEISEEDAMAEGVTGCAPVDDGLPNWAAKVSFQILWDSINGKKHPWANNDWVWAVSFRRVDAR